MNSDNQESGVEDLIRRLREEGTVDGRRRGEELFDEAHQRAEQHLANARLEADRILQEANAEAQRVQLAGEEAVRLAVRDATLRLRSELVEQFSQRVRRLVAQTLESHDFLQALILEVAGKSISSREQQLKVLLPEDVVGIEQLRREPEEVKEGTLSHFVLALAGQMLREGVEICERTDGATGNSHSTNERRGGD